MQSLFERWRPHDLTGIIGQDKAIKALRKLQERGGFGGRAYYGQAARRGLPLTFARMEYDAMKRAYSSTASLIRAGIEYDDAVALQRIERQLHRWHELECGIDAGGIERDEVTSKVTWYCSRTGQRRPFPDRETPALKRLAKIMAKYPTLRSYVQGDPRGGALYILRPGDVPSGCEDDAYYSRGVCV